MSDRPPFKSDRPLFKRGDPVIQHDDFCVSVGALVDCGDGAWRVQGEWEMRFPNPLDAMLAQVRAEGRREGAQACVEAARAAWNEASSQPSRSNPPGYDVAAMQAGASIVVDAVERAAGEEPKR